MTATQAYADAGRTCLAEDEKSRATCLAMIGVVRELLRSGSALDPACAAGGGDDPGLSYAVMDWLRARPERQGEDLTQLIREALATIDPCAQGPLIPNPPVPDEFDTP